jgi:outer membrane protein OmpA-like peptidoglycan-associated protein
MTKKIQKKSMAIVSACSLLVASSFVGGCDTAGKNTGIGAAAGAAGGAVLGAVVGGKKNRGKAAAIGAVIGAGIGGTVGLRMDKQAKELAKIAETKRTDQGLITKLKSDILFDTGKAELKPAAVSNLGEMAQIMKKYPENVLTIKGYTDSTGSFEVNQRLSEQRANAVRGQLIGGGIPANTIEIVGMGPEAPIADNTSPAGRAQNRRVEIEITVDESKVPKK